MTAKADALRRVVYPKIVAERLVAHRMELGLPSVERQFARGKHHGGGVEKLSPESVEIIRKITEAKIRRK